MQQNSVLTDRAAGVLLAQAAGDALGVPYEFATPPSGDAAMLGGGLGDFAPGEYSDDTQMAVCIARVAATGADLTADAALGGVEPGPGSAQRLREAAADLHARTGRTAGNGALMRTGVVGLVALDDRGHTAACARAVAVLTHPDPLAVDSCVLWSEAVRVAVTTGTVDVAAGLDLLAAWAAITSTPVPQDGPGAFACEHQQRALHAAVRAGTTPTPSPPSPGRCSVPGGAGRRCRRRGGGASTAARSPVSRRSAPAT